MTIHELYLFDSAHESTLDVWNVMKVNSKVAFLTSSTLFGRIAGASEILFQRSLFSTLLPDPSALGPPAPDSFNKN